MKTSTACESCQKWLLLIFSIWSYPQLQTADTDSLSRDAKQSLVMCGDHWTVRLLPSMEAKLAEFEHLYRWVGLSVWRVTLICHEIFLTFSSSWPGSRDPLFLVTDGNPSIHHWVCGSSLSPSLKISASRSIIIITIIKAMIQIKTHFKQFLNWPASHILLESASRPLTLSQSYEYGRWQKHQWVLYVSTPSFYCYNKVKTL